MKILLATNSFWPADKEGGPPFSNYYLARALAQLGEEVWVVTTDRNGPERLQTPLDRWTDLDGLRVFYASTRDGAWIRSSNYAHAAHEAARSADAAIHSGIFWNHTGLSAWRACRREQVRFITIPRGLLRPWALGHKAVKKAIYWRLVARRIVADSAALIALAHREAEELKAGGLRVPVHVVPNGAHVDGLGADAPETGPASPPYVLFLGRIHKGKGLEVLIPAFDEAARSHPGLRLAIAGPVDEAYARTLAELLGASASRHRIDLLGTVAGAKKAELLRGAAAFALTSQSEGMPMAVLEALAAGVPCVVTEGCNLPEVGEAGAGFVVTPSPAEVAAALSRVVGDPSLGRAMASRARFLAERQFSWQAVGGTVRELLGRYRRAGVEAARRP